MIFLFSYKYALIHLFTVQNAYKKHTKLESAHFKPITQLHEHRLVEKAWFFLAF